MVVFPLAISFWLPRNVLFIPNNCVWLCLINWLTMCLMQSVAWISKSKEPMCCWLVSLAACKTQFLIALAGQSVKPNRVLAWLWMFWFWAMCEPIISLVPCGNIPSSGVAAMLRDWWAHWPMVGWNVAATYLVVGWILDKISILIYFTSAIIFDV